MKDLFHGQRIQPPLPQAEITLVPRWMDLSALHLQSLVRSIPWQSEQISMFGRTVAVPREICWIGDPEAHYRYSGVDHAPLPWPEEVLAIRDRLQESSGHRFNAVLANRYRSGADSMGWHSDDEPELGREPVIASVSFGEKRRFTMRHRQTRQRWATELGDGDLLIMAGPTQRFWQHQVAKTRRPAGERINLTFRLIHTSG